MKKLILSLVIVMSLALAACGGSDSGSGSGDANLYDNAVVSDGVATIEADSSQVDADSLTDVYFNYFESQELDYLIIVYADDSTHGAYMNSAFVEKDVTLSEDPSFGYMLEDDSTAIMYIPKDGELKEQ